MLKLSHYAGHFHSRHSCVCAGVAFLCPASVDGFFERFAGQHAEDRRGFRIVVNLAYATNHLLGIRPAEPLESLGSLKKLNMWEDRRVTNAGIRRLGGLTQLEDPDIRSTKINDTGMRDLEKLTNLKKLSLGQTKITDYGVEHIKGLTKLQSLNLGYTGLTDDGMPFLKDMTELENLYLARTAVSDAGMPVIKGFTKLKMLYMPGVYVTDVGLENLKDSTELQQLVISDSKVTDAGLVYLKGLRKLSTVDLTGTRVTEAGLKELGVALPHCHVTIGRRPHPQSPRGQPFAGRRCWRPRPFRGARRGGRQRDRRRIRRRPIPRTQVLAMDHDELARTFADDGLGQVLAIDT